MGEGLYLLIGRRNAMVAMLRSAFLSRQTRLDNVQTELYYCSLAGRGNSRAFIFYHQKKNR